jgi:hypothetical protein
MNVVGAMLLVPAITTVSLTLQVKGNTKARVTREADVKCGSYFGGMLSDDLDVRWRD